MRKSTLYIILLSLISVFIFSQVSYAYWIWTPETKKFVNPKYAVKDSPKEQFDWAMSFYNIKDFQRAATEFEKLVKQYEFSEYASKSQYYVGLCYENMQKFYMAYENYQKTIDNFPHISNTEEILAREYNIGNIYLNKPSPKVLKTDIMAPLDRAIEIYKKVVTNAPYGKYAQDAQFKMGEALKKSERYEEAVEAFHKVAEDYPNSKLVSQAMFEEADCAYKASLRPAYDATSTDNAIKTFEKFVDKNKGADLTKEADRTMRRLKDNVAEKSFRTAEFYESQGKKEAAAIYYQDVIDTYPDSSFVPAAKAKIEKLKTKEVKKIFVPIEIDKKKAKPSITQAPSPEIVPEAKPVTKEPPKKKPWSPLSFENKKPVSEKKPVVQEEPKKKLWSPLNFSSKPASKEPVSEKKTEIITQEAPKKKSWNPLNLNLLGSNKENKAKEKPNTKAWQPLNFNAKKEKVAKASQAPIAATPTEEAKKEVPAAPVVVEAPKAEPTTQAVEVPKAEPADQAVEVPNKEEPVLQVKATPKKKSWNPLNLNLFGSKKESVAKEAPKSTAWKPLNFNTDKSEDKGEWKPLSSEKQ